MEILPFPHMKLQKENLGKMGIWAGGTPRGKQRAGSSRDTPEPPGFEWEAVEGIA